MSTDRQNAGAGALPPEGDGAAQARRVQSVRGTKGDQAREDRIKAALKANIARRKAQARARATGDTTENHGASDD